MNISQLKLGSIIAIATILLAACGAQQNTKQTTQSTKQQSNVQERKINDPLLIPYYGGVKQYTTNQHGNITQGLGTNTYSIIGSSGLHSAGISSNLESRLSGAGIGGIRVLVLDDNIVLVQEKKEISATHYDGVQKKVLTPYGGQSGKGPEPANTPGADRTGRNVSFENLDLAKVFMGQMFGSNVKILMVNDPQAVEIVNRIKSNLKSSSYSADQVSGDVQNLLRMAK